MLLMLQIIYFAFRFRFRGFQLTECRFAIELWYLARPSALNTPHWEAIKVEKIQNEISISLPPHIPLNGNNDNILNIFFPFQAKDWIISDNFYIPLPGMENSIYFLSFFFFDGFPITDIW